MYNLFGTLCIKCVGQHHAFDHQFKWSSSSSFVVFRLKLCAHNETIADRRTTDLWPVPQSPLVYRPHRCISAEKHRIRSAATSQSFGGLKYTDNQRDANARSTRTFRRNFINGRPEAEIVKFAFSSSVIIESPSVRQAGNSRAADRDCWKREIYFDPFQFSRELHLVQCSPRIFG